MIAFSGNIVLRLRRHLESVSARYPSAWGQLAMFRREKEQLGGWPDWCDVPLSAAYTIVMARRDQKSDSADISIIGGLGSWRLTQGIYRFDLNLLEALWTTPIARVPRDLLHRLPEWCIYLEMPKRQLGIMQIYGAFIWLECNIRMHRTELRALLDIGDFLYPIVLHLTSGTLDECIEAGLADSMRHMPLDAGMPAEIWNSVRHRMGEIWSMLISPALYLCSDKPDILSSVGLPVMPTRSLSRTTEGSIIPAPAPVEWLIGSKIGERLQEARDCQDQAEEHDPLKMHARRACWQPYWIGAESGKRKFGLRWIHPLLAEAEKMQTTINLVE